jgi:hypothetical protein
VGPGADAGVSDERPQRSRTLRLCCGPANGRNRRDSAASPGVGEGRLSMLCRPPPSRLYPGEPPQCRAAIRVRGTFPSRFGWVRVTKVAMISARFSKSLARRRFQSNQEKVRSTTQRRGRTTKPFMSLTQIMAS